MSVGIRRTVAIASLAVLVGLVVWTVLRPPTGEEDWRPGSESVSDRTDRAGAGDVHDHATHEDSASRDGAADQEPLSEDTTPVGRLVRAASADDVSVVSALIEDGVPADAEDSRGHRALHQAAANDAVRVIRFLAEHGVDLDAPDGIGWTALTRASHFGSLSAARELLAYGADPDAQHAPNWVTPLMQLMGGWHQAVDGDAKAPPFREKDRVALAAALFQAGADPNLEGGGSLPMHIVLFMDNIELLTLFVNGGARVSTSPSARIMAHWPGPWGDLVRSAFEREGVSW